MGKRDILFLVLCVLGLSVLGRTLLSSQREGPLSRRAVAGEKSVDHDVWTECQSVARIADSQFREYWRGEQMEPTSKADLQTRIRRVSLALAGSIPSIEELRALEEIDESVRFQWWVDHLLRDQRTANHIAERLTRAFVGTETGPFLLYRRSRFREWLAEQFVNNRRYDELVRELIAGNGLWTTSPSVNFLTATLDANNDNQPDPIRLAGRTSRAFLGMRIDCLQCHEDQLGNVNFGTSDQPTFGKQEDFHQLAAFFCDAKVSLLGIHNGEGTYEVEYLGESEATEPPALPPFLPQARPKDGSLRDQLAGWVTAKENRPFARTAVNRMWAIAFGRPLVEPIDDIPLNPPVGGYPPALELLADDLIQNDFDVQRLLRIIMSMEPFHLDSRSLSDDGEIASRHYQVWAAFPFTRLRPDQVARSVMQSCSVETLDERRHFVVQLQTFDGVNKFVSRYGDTGEDEFSETPGTLPQRLVMMNGELVKSSTKNDLFSASGRIANISNRGEQAVELTYLCCLSRKPTSVESEHFSPRIQQAIQDKDITAKRRHIEDLFWVLLNTTEFNWNH